MFELYNEYKKLNIDGSFIGLEDGDEEGGYFCTPVGAKVIGWDNGIHYCFIDGFGEMVFCVNPESFCDYYVYPIAENFRDFLSLLVAAKNTNELQQMIVWEREDWEEFKNDEANIEWNEKEEVVSAIEKIAEELDIEPMEDPFSYVKELQEDFPYEKIEFTDEYYETSGEINPNRDEYEDDDFDEDDEEASYLY